MFFSSFTTNDPQAMHMRPILIIFIHALYISSLLQICFEYTVGFWLVFYKINFENSGPSGPFIIHKNTF